MMLSSVQFHDVQPYFPGQGGTTSQGKLFRDPKPIDEHRWPRGYTPERMQEVRRATSENWPHDDQGLIHKGYDYAHSLTGATMDSPYLVPHGKRLVREAIARSDVPVEHLKDLQEIEVHSGLRSGAKARGYYTPAEKTIGLEPMKGDFSRRSKGQGGRIETNPGAKTTANRQQAQPIWDATLIHEIGHHSDLLNRFNGNPGEMISHINSQGGKGLGDVEGVADKYMLTRFRNDPRNQRRTNFNPQIHTYGATGGIPGYPEQQTAEAGRHVKAHFQGIAKKQRENENRKAAASAQRKSVSRYKAQQRRRKG